MIQSTSFLKAIQSAPDITPAEVDYVLGFFKKYSVKAKEHIVREGEICKQIAYVDTGAFCFYTLTDSGKKSVIHFAFEDWWTGDLPSFINRTPATTYWQAIENSEIIAINRTDFEKLCNTSKAFKAFYDLKTQRGYIKSLEKSALDKSESAEERYLRMMKDHPQIILRAPHYDVASYLGIAPESLSRIRNKIISSK